MPKIRDHGIEQRSYIRYLVKSGMSGYAIKEKLKEVYGEKAISKSSVYKWVKRFSEGREDVTDDNRSGRPATTNTEENVERIKNLLNENENISLRKIAKELNLTKGSTIRIVSKNIRNNSENNICFMCLSKDDNLNIIQKTDTNMQHLIYIMPELTAADTKTSIHVCETCDKAISSFYYFKKMCLENSKQWKQFSKTIKENKTQSQKSQEKKQSNTEPLPTKTETIIKQEMISEHQENINSEPENVIIKCEPFSEVSDEYLEDGDVSDESESNGKEKQWAGTCVLCNRLFTNESLFRRHFKMHSEVRNYKCEKCSKSFLRKSHLNRHLRNHSKEVYSRKTFKCPGCNSGFVRKLNLKKHMRHVCVNVPPESEINI